MEENKPSFVQKLLARILIFRRECLWGATILCLLGAVLIITLSSGISYRDYLEAKALMAKWQESPSDAQNFQKLSECLHKGSEFFSHYEPYVAQTLIGQSSFAQAEKYMEKPIHYLRKESPEHAYFSEITLLIEKGLYQEALEKSIRLKEQMGKEESHLYFQNLLRIAVLQKQLKNGPGEITAWNDCENFLEWQDGLTNNSESILVFYKKKNIDLRGYIKSQLVTF
ncbi:MAG: hypothetical protein K2X08_03115 [Chlamydiales bacterium]|nr:hypothetical protein [Chlamydiales bacterium]